MEVISDFILPQNSKKLLMGYNYKIKKDLLLLLITKSKYNT